MRTSGFDIESLLHFTPPEYRCAHCCALYPAAILRKAFLRCPVCGIEYIAAGTPASYETAFEAHGLRMRTGGIDPFEHAKRLALIAHRTRASLLHPHSAYTPMRGLLEAFNAAQSCIHFSTYGISALLLGALKMAGLRVEVRGVVSGIRHDALYRELTEFVHEAPGCEFRVATQEMPNFPHQKVIVIDGLLAFKGSANMTDFAWRKAAQGREVIEPVTDTADVVELHNRYFSPTWAALGATPGEQIYLNGAIDGVLEHR